MKNNIMVLSIAAMVATPSIASADTILGVFAGISQWQASLKGDIGDSESSSTSLDSLGIDDESNTTFWAALEHPIPIVPNIRISLSDISTHSTGEISSPFTLDGQTISGNVETNLDLSHKDVTLYYEFLDNWVTFDAGITARMFSGGVDMTTSGETASASLDGTIPMLYINAQFDLPLTGWHVTATGNTISYRGDKIQDFAAKVGYEFEGLPLFDIGVNLGLRDFSFVVEELDDIFVDASMSGAFLEVTAHF